MTSCSTSFSEQWLELGQYIFKNLCSGMKFIGNSTFRFESLKGVLKNYPSALLQIDVVPVIISLLEMASALLIKLFMTLGT